MDSIMLFIKDYQTLIAGSITSIIVAIGLALTYRQIVYMKKDRHSQLIMELTAMWDSPTICESRNAILNIETKKECLCKKLKESEKTSSMDFITLFRVGNYFEHMGWLVDKGYIENSDLVVDLCGDSIIYYYEQYRKYISEQRNAGHKNLFEYFEKLADISKAKKSIKN